MTQTRLLSFEEGLTRSNG